MGGSCASRAAYRRIVAIIVGMIRPLSLVALTLAALLTLSFSTRAQEGPHSEEASRIRESIAVLNEIMSTSDTSIPTSITKKAEAIAIFPGTLKAGFIFGGMRGRGILSARNEDGWSVPTFMTLTGGSIGLQIGGQATDLVLVITNRRGLEQFVRNQFKFGADASAAAGPVGRDAQASTDLQMRAEILSYSRARGLFAGVSINGSTVRADVDANQRFYGKRLTGPQLVLDKTIVESSTPVPEWVQTLSRHITR
jgi:lipid-binding SYLF domain-containing protein